MALVAKGEEKPSQIQIGTTMGMSEPRELIISA